MPSHPAAGCPDAVFVPSPAPHGFLIDMDGVIYRGSELIPGAERFIAELLALELPFFFLTNDSQRTRRDVVTNLDPNCPTRAARKELGLDDSRTTMIGDTMETDIPGGVRLGYRTILVLSGGTRRADLAAFAYRPDMVVGSIADLSAADLAGLGAREVA